MSLTLALASSPDGELAASTGWHCALVETLYAIGPGAFLAFAVRRRWLAPGDDAAPREQIAMGAVLGLGALVGQAVLSLRCPVDGLAHDLAFHTLPLVALIALGTFIAHTRIWRNGLWRST